MLYCQLRSPAVPHPVGGADEAGHGHTWRSTTLYSAERGEEGGNM